MLMPPARPKDDIAELLNRLEQRDRSALSRLLTLAARSSYCEELKAALSSAAQNQQPVIAVAGSGGVGKSSLLDAITLHLAGLGQTAGIACCDPQSPITGGALLGDRCRIAATQESDRVFLRSLATESGAQGVAVHLDVMLQVMRAFGFDHLLVETVGIGQGDTAIHELADVVVLVLQPQTGDELQWEKAGVLEVADVVVINKADLPGADRTVIDVKHHVDVPVVATSVSRNTGIEELWQVIKDAATERLNKRVPQVGHPGAPGPDRLVNDTE